MTCLCYDTRLLHTIIVNNQPIKGSEYSELKGHSNKVKMLSEQYIL